MSDTMYLNQLEADLDDARSRCRWGGGEMMKCVSAGLCPKPPRTYGQGHECKLEWPHGGLHVCQNCGMEFNAGHIPWAIEGRAALVPMCWPLNLRSAATADIANTICE